MKEIYIFPMLVSCFSAGLLLSLCVNAKRERKSLRSEFDRIYDAVIDNGYEIEQLKKEK